MEKDHVPAATADAGNRDDTGKVDVLVNGRVIAAFVGGEGIDALQDRKGNRLRGRVPAGSSTQSAGT